MQGVVWLNRHPRLFPFKWNLERACESDDWILNGWEGPQQNSRFRWQQYMMYITPTTHDWSRHHHHPFLYFSRSMTIQAQGLSSFEEDQDSESLKVTRIVIPPPPPHHHFLSSAPYYQLHTLSMPSTHLQLDSSLSPRHSVKRYNIHRCPPCWSSPEYQFWTGVILWRSLRSHLLKDLENIEPLKLLYIEMNWIVAC